MKMFLIPHFLTSTQRRCAVKPEQSNGNARSANKGVNRSERPCAGGIYSAYSVYTAPDRFCINSKVKDRSEDPFYLLSKENTTPSSVVLFYIHTAGKTDEYIYLLSL